jgi:hypothetical protein
MAVGSYDNYYGTKPTGLLVNGSSYTLKLAKLPFSITTGSLTAVDCITATDCFAVGSAKYPSQTKTLIERWDGTAWTIVPSPNKSNGGSFTGVDCVTSSDCWAVGSLLAHWNGTAWSMVDTGTPFTTMNSISCIASNDCWATAAGESTQPTVLHWNGTAWTYTAIPPQAPGSFVTLNGVACTSASNCLVVGKSGYVNPYAALWNGTTWSLKTAAAPTGGSTGCPSATPCNRSELAGVSCVSATSCYAVGSWSTPYSTKSLIEHWDGIAWSIMSSPNRLSSTYNRVSGVSCINDSNCHGAGSSTVPPFSLSLVVRFS